MEELSSAKSRLSKNTGRLSHRYKDRLDFYFCLAGEHFIAETKECWSGAGDESTDSTYYIGKKMEPALSDIRKVKSYSDRKLAIVFAKPLIPVKKRKHAARLLKCWIRLVRTMEVDAIAWYLPINALRIKYNNRVCLGLAILIKER